MRTCGAYVRRSRRSSSKRVLCCRVQKLPELHLPPEMANAAPSRAQWWAEVVPEPPHEEAAVALATPLPAVPIGAGYLQQTRQPADAELVAAEVHGCVAGQRCPDHGLDQGGLPLDVGLDDGGVEVLDVVDVQDGVLVAFVGCHRYLSSWRTRLDTVLLRCALGHRVVPHRTNAGVPAVLDLEHGTVKGARPSASRTAPSDVQCASGGHRHCGRSCPTGLRLHRRVASRTQYRARRTDNHRRRTPRRPRAAIRRFSRRRPGQRDSRRRRPPQRPVQQFVDLRDVVDLNRTPEGRRRAPRRPAFRSPVGGWRGRGRSGGRRAPSPGCRPRAGPARRG